MLSGILPLRLAFGGGFSRNPGPNRIHKIFDVTRGVEFGVVTGVDLVEAEFGFFLHPGNPGFFLLLANFEETESFADDFAGVSEAARFDSFFDQLV